MPVTVHRIHGEGDALEVSIRSEGRETSSHSIYHLYADGHSKATGWRIAEWIRELRRVKKDIHVTIKNVRRPSR